MYGNESIIGILIIIWLRIHFGQIHDLSNIDDDKSVNLHFGMKEENENVKKFTRHLP